MDTAESPERPAWWDWELERSAHALKRMVGRRFSEFDLRTLMESATSVRQDEDPGRWIVETSHASRPWERDGTSRDPGLFPGWSVNRSC